MASQKPDITVEPWALITSNVIVVGGLWFFTRDWLTLMCAGGAITAVCVIILWVRHRQVEKISWRWK